MKKIYRASLLLAGPAFAHVPYVEGHDFQDDAGFTVQPPIEKSLVCLSWLQMHSCRFLLRQIRASMLSVMRAGTCDQGRQAA